MDFSFISTAVAAIEKGAASVYHDVLATGAAVTAWEASNPVIAALVASGTGYATDLLTRLGVPVGTIELVGADIIAGLKQLAAADATVPSVALATTTITALAPVVAEVAAAVEPVAAAEPVITGIDLNQI